MNNKMYVYIKLSVAKKYVSFATPLSEEEYNNIGSTWADYLNNKWVLLSDEQVLYRDEHPSATVKEVWDMSPSQPHARTLEEAKNEKLMQVAIYDQSSAVNEFTYSGV